MAAVTIFHCPNERGQEISNAPHQRLAPLIAAGSDWSHRFFSILMKMTSAPRPYKPHTRFASLFPQTPAFYLPLCEFYFSRLALERPRSAYGGAKCGFIRLYMSDSTRSAQSPANTLFHQHQCSRDMNKSGNNASNYELWRCRLNITRAIFAALMKLYIRRRR